MWAASWRRRSSSEGHGVGTLGSLVHRAGIIHGTEAEALSAPLHGYGVENPDFGTGSQQQVDDHEGRSFAQVVGLGLEGKAPKGDALAVEVAAQSVAELLEEYRFLPFVDSVYSLDDLHRAAVFAGRAG